MKMKWKIMDNEWIMNGKGVMQDPGSQWGHPWLDPGDRNLLEEKLDCEGKIGNENWK